MIQEMPAKQDQAPLRKLLKSKEVCALLGVCPNTLVSLEMYGLRPIQLTSRSIRYDPADVADFLSRCRDLK